MEQVTGKAVKALSESLRQDEEKRDAGAEAGATAWEQQASGLAAWELASLRVSQGWVIGQPVAPADFAAALESVRTEVVK